MCGKILPPAQVASNSVSQANLVPLTHFLDDEVPDLAAQKIAVKKRVRPQTATVKSPKEVHGAPKSYTMTEVITPENFDNTFVIEVC